MFDVDFTISKQDEMLPSTPVPQDLPPPSENELRLGRKVLQLEKERDSISVGTTSIVIQNKLTCAGRTASDQSSFPGT